MADRDLTGRTLGEFILRERIGGGGGGEVYRAEQPKLKRTVVVKVLNETQQHDQRAVERFLREAQLASQLDHRYAAHVYDSGISDDGLLWIVMEYVPGISLQRWLAKHGPMPFETFVPFFERVAQVVQAAHKRGIVHRDLKPSNVMVMEEDGQLWPKLLDFGIAKRADAVDNGVEDFDVGNEVVALLIRSTPQPRLSDRTTKPNSVVPARRRQLTRPGGMGSLAYMSPEQWDNAYAVGPAAEIYSLGVVVYESLTGRVPFAAADAKELYDLHLLASVPLLGGDVPPEVNRTVRRALAKRPEDRHGSPLELAAELCEVLDADPREQIRSLTRRWVERHRIPDLLARGQVLEDLVSWMRRAPTGVLRPIERSFVATSQRRARRTRRLRQGLVTIAAVSALGLVIQQERTRTAEQVAKAKVIQAELEQGRAALLHGESEALSHLAEAYKGDQSSSTAFMYARAAQPRLDEQARLPSSFERMWWGMYSPNGKQIATTDDQNAQIWDAQTHGLLFILHHGDVVYSAVYSRDGSRLFTGCGDGAIRIWDTASGMLLHELRRDKVKARYYVVALSSDGKLVAGLDLGVAHVWNAVTGAPLAELREDAASSFPLLAFSADGGWLAIGTGKDVHVFDTKTWTRVRDISGSHIHSLSWDPTGARLLTGSAEGNASIWEIPTGEQVHHLREAGDSVDAVAFSPDGRSAAMASRDGAEQVWDASSTKLRSQINLLRNKILSIEFDPTSSLIVASSSSGSVAVSDAMSGMPIKVLDGPTAVVRVAHFDPSSQLVLGVSWDGTARIWTAASPYLRWRSAPISDDCGLVTSLEPDRRYLITPCRDHPTRVWDTAHDKLVAELPPLTFVGGEFEFAYPAVSAAGDRAAVARGNEVEVYELPSARLLRKIQHGARVHTVTFAASGRDIVSGAVDGSVIITRDNGTLTMLPMSSAGIDAVAFLPDDRVVVADAGRHLRICDLAGVTLADFETRARVATLRMSPDGRRLVTVSALTGKVVAPELWDVEGYRAIAQLTSIGQGQVYSARFIANDQLITACGDGAIRRWGAETGQLHQTYRGGSRFLADATMSADGTMLIGGGGDGQLRFWDLSSGRPLWTLPAHGSHLIGVHVEGTNIVTRGFSGDIARWTFASSEQVIEACDHSEHCAIVTQ